MHKLILAFVASCLLACNNSTTTKEKSGDPVKRSAGLPVDSVARVATFSFIDGCMENAKLTLGDQKAYAFCKCIYDQLEAENPGADSIQLNDLGLDTARIAKMAANCR